MLGEFCDCSFVEIRGITGFRYERSLSNEMLRYPSQLISPTVIIVTGLSFFGAKFVELSVG